jgi:hypothetical protein
MKGLQLNKPIDAIQTVLNNVTDKNIYSDKASLTIMFKRVIHLKQSCTGHIITAKIIKK